VSSEDGSLMKLAQDCV